MYIRILSALAVALLFPGGYTNAQPSKFPESTPTRECFAYGVTTGDWFVDGKIEHKVYGVFLSCNGKVSEFKVDGFRFGVSQAAWDATVAGQRYRCADAGLLQWWDCEPISTKNVAK